MSLMMMFRDSVGGRPRCRCQKRQRDDNTQNSPRVVWSRRSKTRGKQGGFEGFKLTKEDVEKGSVSRRETDGRWPVDVIRGVAVCTIQHLFDMQYLS